MATLGQRLKTARLHAKLTQAELAEKAGVAQSAVSRIEREEADTSGYVAIFAKICGVRTDWLALEDGEMLESATDDIVEMIKNNPDMVRLLKAAAPLGKYQVDVLVDTSNSLAKQPKQGNGTQ